MLHTEDGYIRDHLSDGLVGLELESQRVDRSGHLSHRSHPFGGNPNIDRDFSEAQIEINTPPMGSAADALDFMRGQLSIVHKDLEYNDELLWPFSNPPIIRDEEDIPIAVYTGDQVSSYRYRQYLSRQYGRYIMTYSGIHFNYSFPDDILKRNYELAFGDAPGADQLRSYKDEFYLELAGRVLVYSWIPVALIAASPVADNSFYEKGRSGDTVFTGAASLRCSERGYWNDFTPVLSYRSLEEYVASIDGYVEKGLLTAARELYYPVRIKPAGKYTMEALLESGANHIELRMIDLNPFTESGADINDLEFLRLFLIWLAASEITAPGEADQIQAIRNHKNAAAYDWDLAGIVLPDGSRDPLRSCLVKELSSMRDFYKDDEAAAKVIDTQLLKTSEEKYRYAVRVKEEYGVEYINKGLTRAKEIQRAYNV